jgi:chromosome segregation ATPase
MATPKSCSRCEKGRGTSFCVGCQAYFCKKCHQQHRDDMANQLEGFIENRNELQYQITKATEEKNFDSPLLVEIEDWQSKTIEKVKKVAEQAKEQVIKLLNSKKTEIKFEFEKFSKELIQLKDNDDLLENDLEHLKQTVGELNQKLKELSKQPEIELCKEQGNQIEWDILIYIREKTSFTPKPPRPKPLGKFIIEYIFTLHVV